MRTQQFFIVAALCGLASVFSFACGSGVTYWLTPRGDKASLLANAKGDKKVGVEGEGAKAGKKGAALPPAVTKPADQWRFQDLHDHLASKGWLTVRKEGRGGMWFVPAYKPGMLMGIEGGGFIFNDTGEVTMSIEQSQQNSEAVFAKCDGYGPNRLPQYRFLSEKDRHALDAADNKVKFDVSFVSLTEYQKVTREIFAKSKVCNHQAFLATRRNSTKVAMQIAAETKDVQQREMLAWESFTFEGRPEALAMLKKLLP